MGDKLTDIDLSESGYIITTDTHGRKTKYPIADSIRTVDIPTGLTYSQVAGVKTLANLIVVLIRTLIDREVLDESFMENDDFDLDALIYVIEQIGGAYDDPDISVPNT